jgi:hypothetical protein
MVSEPLIDRAVAPDEISEAERSNAVAHQAVVDQEPRIGRRERARRFGWSVTMHRLLRSASTERSPTPRDK